MEFNMIKTAREIKRIYKETDVSMKNISKICSEGCSYCCHQIIPVHVAEEIPITKYISENLDESVTSIIKLNLINWLKYFNENTPYFKVLDEKDISIFAKKHANDFISCPFLIDHKCSIYMSRPLVCRTFSVNDNVEECKKKPDRNGTYQGYEIQEVKFREIANITKSVYIRLLPYVVADYFEIEHNFKPIPSYTIDLSKQELQF